MPREINLDDIVVFVERTGKPIRSGAHANLIGWLLTKMNITVRSYDRTIELLRSLTDEDRLICEWDGGHATTLTLREWVNSTNDEFEEVPSDSEAWAQVSALRAQVQELQEQVALYDQLHAEQSVPQTIVAEVQEVVLPCTDCSEAEARADAAAQEARSARSEKERLSQLLAESREREERAWAEVREQRQHSCSVAGMKLLQALPCGCTVVIDPRKCDGSNDINGLSIFVSHVSRRQRREVRTRHQEGADYTLL